MRECLLGIARQGISAPVRFQSVVVEGVQLVVGKVRRGVILSLCLSAVGRREGAVVAVALVSSQKLRGVS